MEEVLDHNQEAEQIFRQYGRLLELVAAAQLPGRPEDAEECVNDTWLRAWNAMPPQRPSVLARLQELVQAAAELPGKVRRKEQERGL